MNLLEDVSLRPYQFEDLHLIAAEFFKPAGNTRLLGVWPTAAGKTVLAANFLKHPEFHGWLEAHPGDSRKVLFIAHAEELLKQAKKKILFYNPHLNVQIEKAEQVAELDADVVVASIQTLSKGKRLTRFNPDQFRVVVIDEAHHSAAQTYRSVLQYFGFLPPDDFMPKTHKMGVEEALTFQRLRLATWDQEGRPDRVLLGITATPVRGDKVGLELVFQEIVFQRSILELIRAGFLSPIRAYRIESDVSLDTVKTKGGDFDQVELSDAINIEERNRLIVKAWLAHAVGRKTIAFCSSVAHATSLAECFNAHGVRSAVVTGKTENRGDVLDGFSGDTYDLLTNFAVLTEGYDEPNIQCIIPARPTKSAALLTQMIGRGLRLAKEQGKVDCIVLDIVDVTRKHSLMTAPTLLGLPSEFDAKGGDLSEAVDKIEELAKANPLMDVSGARSLEDLEMRAHEVDLFGAFDAPEIHDNGTLAWMKTSEDSFEVAYPGTVTRETMRIERNAEGLYAVTRNEFNEATYIGNVTPNIKTAFAQAENWLRKKYPGQTEFLKRSSTRRKEPATDVQKSRLARLGAKHMNLDQLTMGQASDLISVYTKRAA